VDISVMISAWEQRCIHTLTPPQQPDVGYNAQWVLIVIQMYSCQSETITTPGFIGCVTLWGLCCMMWC